jgi:hypothetical protein
MKKLEDRKRTDHLVFTVEQDARDYAAALDVVNGPFPRSGINIGGGRHAPSAVSDTARYAQVRKHPTRAEWAVACKPRDQALDGSTIRANGRDVVMDTDTAAPLAADWTQ